MTKTEVQKNDLMLHEKPPPGEDPLLVKNIHPQSTFQVYPSFPGPRPVYSSASEGTLLGAQTSMEVHYNDTPSTTAARKKIYDHPAIPRYKGLSNHYSAMGASIDAFVHPYHPPLALVPPIPLTHTDMLPHGYVPPANTPDDSQEMNTASHRSEEECSVQ